VKKCRRMMWMGNVARMSEKRVRSGFWLLNPKERDYVEDVSMDGRIVLRWLIKK
jgi:hypothetical protein